MSRRTLLFALAGLVLALYFFPQLPPARAWLLRQAEPYAARAGYAVSYAGSRGNPWTDVTLLGATVSGAGLELSAERLGLRYTLPALIAGQLPLALDAAGVRGSLDAQTLLSGGGSGGESPVQVRLRSLQLDDAQVALTRLPYTLPDLTITDLSATSAPGGARLAATLSSAEGAAEVEGTLTLSPLAFEGRVPRADVAIARHWWPGLEGGTASGTLKVANGRVSADAVIESGSLSFMGERVTAIAGPVHYRDARIDAELTARALGGEVAVQGGVGIDARRWYGDASGQVDLERAALWLARFGGTRLASLPLSGQAQVEVSASGWTALRLSGEARGGGQLLGYPLDEMSAEFEVASDAGVRAALSARLAGGPLTAALRPTPSGLALRVQGQDLALVPDALANLDLELSSGAAGLSGDGRLTLAGDLLGRALELSADLGRDSDGYQLFATGAALGGQLTGAAVLADGALSGSATVEGLQLPGMASPLTLTASADGPLADVELSGRLDGGPLELGQGQLRARLPVSGSFGARLAAGRLEEIELELAGLRATGALEFAPLQGELRYDLGPVTLAGALAGEAALTGGVLRLAGGAASGEATLAASVLELPGARLEALDGPLRYRLDGGLGLTFSDPQGLELALSDGRLSAELRAFPLRLAGREATLTGHAEAGLDDPLGTLQAELSAESAGASAELSGPADDLALTLRAPALDAELSGRADLGAGSLELSGTLGGYPVTGTAALRAGAVEARAEVAQDGETFTVTLAGPPAEPALAASGRLALTPLAERLGLPLTGTLSGELSRTGDGGEGYAGALSLSGSLLGQPLELRATGTPEGLALGGTADLYGQALELSGTLLPELSLAAAGELGRLEYAQNQLTGSGVAPALAVGGLSVAPQPWQLAGNLAEGAATLRLGDSAFTARREAGGWRLAGEVAQEARWRGTGLELAARVAWSEARPEGEVDGSLAIDTPAGRSSLGLGGDLNALRLEGTLAAAAVASALELPVTPAGELALSAELEPRRGPRYRAEATWRAAGEALELRAAGTGTDVALTASGAGLNASYQGDELRLDAEAFPLEPWLAEPRLAGSLSGAMSHTPQGWWQGELRAELRAPLPAELTLSGDGDTVRLDGALRRQGAELRAAGTLLPRLQLGLAGGYDDLLRASGSVGGHLAAPTLTLELESLPLSLPQARLELPAQRWQLAATLADAGPAARLEDSAGNALTLQDGQLGGALELAFTLAGEPHRLTLAAAGAPATPALSLTVAGPLLAGDGALAEGGFGADLALEPVPDLPGLPAWLAPARAGLSLSGELAGGPSWRGTLSAEGMAADLPATVGLELAGEGLAYRGTGTLELAGQPVALELAGEGAQPGVTAELRGFDLGALPLPLELSGTAEGSVSAKAGAASALQLGLSASGAALGQPFALRLEQRPGEPLALSLAALGAEAELRQTEAGYAFGVTHPAGLSLSGGARLGEAIELSGSGQWQGEPLTLEASYRPAASALSWALELGAARWRGNLAPEPDAAGQALAIGSTLSVPAGSPLPLSGQLELSARSADGAVALERAAGELRLAGEALALELSGRAWPELALSGTLTSERFGSFDLAASGDAAGYHLALAQPGLEVEGDLSPAFAPLAAALSADTTLPLGPGVGVSGALSWRAAEGFGGEADLSAELGDLALRGHAVAAGGLELAAAASWRGAALGEAELRLGPDPLADLTLSGAVRPQLDLAALWPAYAGPPLTVSGELALSGTPAAPALEGPLALSGALAAAGTFRYQGGRGALELSGDGLDLGGSLSAEGWRARLEAEGLALDALAPQLAEPRLNLRATGEGAWGAAPELRAERFELALPESRVSGDLRYREALSGHLRLDLALADLRLGPALAGRLSGTASLGPQDGAAHLGGVLEAQAIGVEGGPARLSGSLLLGGPLARPALTARLRGDAGATGALVAVLEPDKDHYLLSSTLALGALASDLRLEAEGGAISASGTLRYGDLALAVAEASPQRLLLTGRDRLAGWQLEADLDAARAALSGPLASLAPQLSGALELRADWSGPLELRGAVAEAGAFGVALGAVGLASAPGAPWQLELSGTALAATLDLAGGPAWTLQRLELPLADALTLEAAGEGTLSRAQLALTAAGEVAGERYRLPITASYQDGRLELSGTGEALGGSLTLSAAADAAAGWQGSVALAGGNLAGAALELSGTLSGDLAAPQLSAETRLAASGAALAGTLTASGAAVVLEQTLEAPFLSSPLALEGTLWPAAAVTLRDAEGEALRLTPGPDGLAAAGAVTLAAGPLQLSLSAEGEGLELAVAAPQAPGLGLVAALSPAQLADPAAVLASGLTFSGTGDTGGSVTLGLRDGLHLTLADLSYASPAGTVSLAGELSGAGGLHGSLSGSWQGDGEGVTALPWLHELSQLALEATVTPEVLELSARGGGAVVEGSYDWRAGSGSLVAAVVAEGDRADLNLAFAPGRGPSGTMTFEEFPAFAMGALGTARLQGELAVAPEAVAGELTVRLPEGHLSASGRLGLGVLPRALAPLGESGSQLTLESQGFDPSALPFVSGLAPYLSAPLSGTLRLEDGQLSGQLTSAGMTVAERELPLELRLAGTPSAPRLSGTLGGSPFEVARGAEGLSGLIRFERFPLEAPVEAWLGPTDVRTSLTGALRFELPAGAGLGALYLRFASERFTLERDGVVTEGELSFELQDGGLAIQRAEFVGAGSWRASGEASLDALNLRFEAEEADFGPLLGLVPQLAGLGVGAFGSAELVTTGSLRQPTLRLNSPNLELQLAGNRYRLSDATFSLQEGAFVTSAQLEATAPLSGVLRLSGGGRLALAPERTFDATLRFTGDTALPVVGAVDAVDGTVTVRPGEPWRLELAGALGQPFTVSGTLAPLDLQLSGDRLDLKAPGYFLASSETDVRLRFFREEEYHLAGGLTVHQAQVALRREAGSASPAPAPTPPEPASPAAPRTRNPVLERIHFDDVRLQAPQQITFQESFGAAELQADLTLAGTAAAPTLSGSAQSIRGTVRFAGRDFELREAVATFEPSRGIYPTFRVVATTSFDKAEVERDFERTRSAAAPDGAPVDLAFLAPSGPSFNVILTITGEVQPASGAQPYALEVTTTLSSDAEIQEVGAGAPRGLTEPELLSLLTLGRLELSPVLSSQDGLATSLAQGAVDTAVDYFILSELQRQLGEALGLDLFEIRTTTLGSLLTGQGAESFGVSLRIGGYLTDELFASYQIGSLGLADDVALRNEFNVRYDLYPLEFTLIGTLDVLRAPGLTPTPQVGLNLSYAFTPLIRLQAGVTVSSANQGVSFGVNFRW